MESHVKIGLPGRKFRCRTDSNKIGCLLDYSGSQTSALSSPMSHRNLGLIPNSALDEVVVSGPMRGSLAQYS